MFQEFFSGNNLTVFLWLFSGWIMIDRSGTHFDVILNFMRDGTVTLPETAKGVSELLAEAKYYCISELAESCERALPKKERETEPICRVPLITSQKEEQMLISSSIKVSTLFWTFLDNFSKNSHPKNYAFIPIFRRRRI